MDFNSRVKIKENELVHGKGKTIYELADHLNKSHSYLCRISSVNEDLPFPIELAVPAMKFKKNYDLLRMIAIECGFAVCRLPKPAASKGDENKITADYQKTASDAVNALMHFLSEPSKISYKKVEDALNNIIEESCSVKKFVEKKASNQFELGL